MLRKKNYLLATYSFTNSNSLDSTGLKLANRRELTHGDHNAMGFYIRFYIEALKQISPNLSFLHVYIFIFYI